MAKTFEKVKEITGDDLFKKVEAGMDAIVEAIQEVMEKGSKYRVSVQDKNGDIKLKTTATIGAFGLSLAVLLLPIFTILAAAIGVVAGTAYDYKIVVEKVVETPDEKPADPEAPTA